jgi:predicted RNA binding protein YcfA (HicA-like mRNA interferase family)
MAKHEKVLTQILVGRSDANISFSDLRNLLQALGFTVRIRGNHHIFTRPEIEEIINIQPKGSKAKPYQIRQIRGIILKYKLGTIDEY